MEQSKTSLKWTLRLEMALYRGGLRLETNCGGRNFGVRRIQITHNWNIVKRDRHRVRNVEQMRIRTIESFQTSAASFSSSKKSYSDCLSSVPSAILLLIIGLRLSLKAHVSPQAATRWSHRNCRCTNGKEPLEKGQVAPIHHY